MIICPILLYGAIFVGIFFVLAILISPAFMILATVMIAGVSFHAGQHSMMIEEGRS